MADAYQLESPIVSADDFSDTQVDTWASADVGGAWTLVGTAADFDKTSGAGLMAVPGTAGVRGALTTITAVDVDAMARVRVTALAQNVGVGIVVRSQAANLADCYYGGVWFESDNSITTIVDRYFASAHGNIAFNASQGTYAANEWWWIRYQLIGSAHKVKTWKDGTSEPAAWNTTATEATITATGLVGLHGRSGSGAGAQAPQFDDLTAWELGGTITDRYLMEDGAGVYLNEASVDANPPYRNPMPQLLAH